MYSRICLLALALATCAPQIALLAADDVEKEIRASIEQFAQRFDQGQAKELAGHFTTAGEFIDEHGTLYSGRAEIEKLLTKFFAKFPGATVAIEIESIRPLGANLAMEEGTRYISTKDAAGRAQVRYSAVHTKVGDAWQIASLREFSDEPVATAHEQLQSLAWLVGDWVNEGSDGVVKITYRWSEDKNYLLGDYVINFKDKPALKSTQRIGWCPVTQRPRSWLFDADGGYSEGYWSPLKDGWLVKSTTVDPEGRVGSATLTFTPKSAEQFTLAGTDRVIGNEEAPDFEVAIVKKPSLEKKPGEKTSAVEAKPLPTVKVPAAVKTPSTKKGN